MNETKPNPICPHCRKPLADSYIKRIWAQYTSSLRTTHAGGRPFGWRKPHAELDLDSETKPWAGLTPDDLASAGIAEEEQAA